MAGIASSPRAAWIAAALTVLLVADVCAQRLLETTRRRHAPEDPRSTNAIAFADIDGDGDPDAILACPREQGSRLWLNDGAGHFRDETRQRLSDAFLGVLGNANHVVAADFDGDGDADLWFATDTVDRLYTNDGTGVFREAAFGPSPAPATGMLAAADFDRDGDIDVVTGSQLELFDNDGTGRFTNLTASRIPSPAPRATDLAVADLDGDGAPDLALSGSNGDLLLLNDGAGRFRDVTSTHLPTWSRSSAVAAIDVDGDGDLDLAFGGAGTEPSMFLNDGTGRMTLAPSGRIDLVPGVRSIAIGDVDGDGDEDLLYGCGDSFGSVESRLYRNDGTGRFARSDLPPENDQTRDVHLVDLDGDRALDATFANQSAPTRIFVNDGRGRFHDASATPLPRDSNLFDAAIATADVDGDGDLDLVFAGPVRNRLLRNEHGRFTEAIEVNLGRSTSTPHLSFGDVDGDGDPDLLIGQFLYRNYGGGRFATSSSVTSGVSESAFVDVDGDGDQDLVFAQNTSAVYRNDGTGTFTWTTPPSAFGALGLAIGDVDRDGDPDVVFATMTVNRLWLNSGTGTFTDVTATHVPAHSELSDAAALGDLDGDGDLDLVFGNVSGSTYPYNGAERNRVYFNDGAGRFAEFAGRIPLRYRTTRDVALADFDGDSSLDILFVNDGQPDTLLLNDGNGFFRDASFDDLEERPRRGRDVAVGDFDGDGDSDVAVARPDENSVLTNHRLQLTAPVLAITGATYLLEIHAMTPGPTAGVLAVSSSLAPPTVIPGVGTLHLDLGQSVVLPPVAVPGSRSPAIVALPLPRDPALVGRTLGSQALVVASGGSIVRLTNVVVDVVVH